MKKLICCAIFCGFSTDAFAQIIWDNGGNAGGPMSSQRDTTYPFESQVADDFNLPTGPGGELHWAIDQVNWSGTYRGNSRPDEFNIFIYLDDGTGNAPTLPASTSAILREERIPFASVNQTPDPAGFGFNYSYNLPTPFVVDANTKYWLGIQSDVNFPPQWGWNMSSTLQLSEAVFVSEFFGFPLWTPGTLVFGSPQDAAYSLGGRPVPEPATIGLLVIGVLALRRRPL